MMLYVINNRSISLQTDTLGAEIHSLKKNYLEYLWQCGDAWKRYAPILFPFTSSPKDRKYLVNGKEYSMKANHGFARDMEFELVQQSNDELVFELKSNEETKVQYPFDFVLQVSYKLLENGVEIRHTVLNIGETSMFFYLGGHPAFNCPIDKGSFTDYEVVYEKAENLKHQNGNLIENVSDSRIVSLSRALFDNDAIILDHPNSKAITLRSNMSEHSVTVEFPDSDAIAIWSPTGDDRAAFVCLEPWTSVPVDFDNDEEELKKKKHAIKLEAGKEYHYCYRILVE